jgi:hypothetical protein
LSSDDLEAALELLSTEVSTTASDRRSLWTELLENVLVGAFLFGLPLGLIIVAFDLWWGLGLIVAGVVALVLLAVTPESEVSDEVSRFRAALQDTEYVKAAEEVWLRRQSGTAGLLVALLMPAIVLVGTAWLVYGLVVNGDVQPFAILAIGVPSLVFWLWIALNNLQELRYYSQVSSIHDRLQEHSQKAGEEVAISQVDLDVLEHVESVQNKRAVQEAAEHLPAIDQSYAISIAPTALSELEQLADQSPEEWSRVNEAILALQNDPRPEFAKRAAEVPAALKVLAGRRGVDYVVDDENQSVYVVSIEEDKGPVK